MGWEQPHRVPNIHFLPNSSSRTIFWSGFVQQESLKDWQLLAALCSLCLQRWCTWVS